MSGGATIQTPNSILVAGNDQYGNGLQNGGNTVDCPGSRVKLWRKNLDGSICLCRVYQFDKLVSFSSGSKIRFTDLRERYKGTNGTPTIPSPGTMEAGAQYLLSYELDFKISAYTIDEEGDPHYGDHRLEDVGHPVASTDAATKGYVDSVAGDNGGGSDLPVYKFADNKTEVEDMVDGEVIFFDSNNNPTSSLSSIRQIFWKGVNLNGKRPIRDAFGKTWEGNLNSTFTMLTKDNTSTIFRVSMSQVVNGNPRILYNKENDFYTVYWTGGDTAVNTTSQVGLNNGDEITLHCPELFF